MAVIYAKNKTTNEWERVSPQTVEIDDSLTIKGAPADAKATGDALEEIRNQTNDALEEIRNQIGDIDFSDINIEKPDWNQTDANAADFIKNKPFGEEIVEVFNTNTSDIQFEYDEEDNDYTYETEGSKIFDIEEGKTYIVNYNGVEYNCVAYSIVGIYQCIGNAELLLDYPAGNGEPFSFMYSSIDGERQVLCCTECTDYPEISIKAINTKQIDSKYIKDMYYDNGIKNTVIFEEQVIEGFQQESENMYAALATISESLSIVSGNTYLVNWDGVEYETVASLYEIYPYVGNGSYLTGNPSGDIPFFIAFIGNTLMIYTNPSSESHTISITEVIHDKRQIDAKHLSIMRTSQSSICDVIVEGQEGEMNPDIKFEVGKTYYVTLDGIQYDNLVCFSLNGFAIIGSVGFSEYPFAIGSHTLDAYTMYMIGLEGETHTLSIAGQSFVVDEKYLPEMSGSDNSLTFDTTPTEGSTNPVTSEGIKAYVDDNKFVLPDGYPVSENVVIEWDGDTAGKTSVAVAISIGSMGSIPFYKVSDLIFTNDEIKSATCTNVQYGNVISGQISSEVWNGSMASGYIAEDITFVAGMIIVRKAGAALKKSENVQVAQDAIFEETGIYFQKYSDTMYVSGIEITRTVTPMSPALLPSDIAYKPYVDEKFDSITAESIGALPADTVIPSIDGFATEAYVDTKVAALVNSAPEKLNTLDELAAALGDDENFANTVTDELSKKANIADLGALATKDSLTAEDIGAATTTYVDEQVATKQSTIRGTLGQVVGFDENGYPVAQNITLVDTANGDIYRLYVTNGKLMLISGDENVEQVYAVAEEQEGF